MNNNTVIGIGKLGLSFALILEKYGLLGFKNTYRFMILLSYLIGKYDRDNINLINKKNWYE